MKKRIIFFGSIGFIILVGVGLGLITQTKKSLYEFVNVQRGTLVERVLATGTVKKSDEISLAFAASGRVKLISVKVGEHAETGKEFARLDTASIEAQIRNAEAAFDVAEANLIKAQAGASAQDIAVAEAAVIAADVALQNAIIAAIKALEKEYLDAYNSIQTVKAKADGAIQEMDNYFEPCGGTQCWSNWGNFYTTIEAIHNAEVKKVAADAALLRVNATISSVTSASATTSIDSAFISLASDLAIIRAGAQATYDALQTGTQKTAVQAKIIDLDTISATLRNDEQTIISVKSSNDSSIRTAESNLATTKAQLEQKKAPARAVDLEPLRAQALQAKASLDSARAILDNSIIKAPLDGIVIDILVSQGEIAGATGTAIKFLPDAPFTIESNIPEADIADLTLNDPLAITLDAVKNIEYQGRIISIDPASKDVGGVVTYRVTTSIEDGDERIKTGMTANLDIKTDRRENVLSVPQRAVIEQNGKRYVRILNDKQVENIEVVVGIRSADGLIEIRSGVNEGTEIISFVRAQ